MEQAPAVPPAPPKAGKAVRFAAAPRLSRTAPRRIEADTLEDLNPEDL
jgi:hypothetical protein